MTLNNGEHIQASTVIWAAGVKADNLSRGLGLQVSDHGRIVVDSRLLVPETRPTVQDARRTAIAVTLEPKSSAKSAGRRACELTDSNKYLI